MSREASMIGSIARWLLAGLLAASGSACTTVLPPERTEALGPPFNEALKEGYLELAASRWQEGSWELLHFRDKARQAMLGDAVWPDEVARACCAHAARSSAAQRDRLLAVLDAGGRDPGAGRRSASPSQLRLLAVGGQGRPGTLDSACRESFDHRAAGDRAGRDRHLAGELCGAVRTGQRRGRCRRAERRDLGVARGARCERPQRISVIGYADPTGLRQR